MLRVDSQATPSDSPAGGVGQRQDQHLGAPRDGGRVVAGLVHGGVLVGDELVELLEVAAFAGDAART
jgi:hypothetical protein